MMENTILNKIQNLQNAFVIWKKIPFEDRQRRLAELSRLLLERKEEYAALITEEMNKPISQALAEIEKSADMASYYAHAENVLKPESVDTEHQISEVYHEPLGVILGIMPWNFPFWQVLRFAVPTLLAGNAVVLKHASICKKSGDALEQLFRDAGFPENIFVHLSASHEAIEEMIAHPLIKGISLTGSEAAGSAVAETAGRNLKKCVLELGGSDAFVVCADADLEKAAKDAAQARLQNAGQTCVAGKRFIIHAEIYEAFMEKFILEYRRYIPGNPASQQTQLGWMAREDLAEDLEKQYRKALEYGAKPVLSLERIDSLAFTPGILEMNSDNPIRQEELFGPLAMVFKVNTDEEALNVANETMFGLAGAVYTQDPQKALYFAKNMECGSVAINQVFRSDVRMPFNGTKNSGYGVELSLYALREFTVKKSVIGNF